MRPTDPRRKLYLKNQYILLFSDVEKHNGYPDHIISKDGLINTSDHPDVNRVTTFDNKEYFVFRQIENKRDQANLTEIIFNQLDFFLKETPDHDKELFIALRGILIQDIIKELFPNYNQPNNISHLRHFNNLKAYQEAMYVVHYNPDEALNIVENDTRKKQHATIDEQLVALKTFAPELWERLYKENKKDKGVILEIILNYNQIDCYKKFNIVKVIEQKADMTRIDRLLEKLNWFK